MGHATNGRLSCAAIPWRKASPLTLALMMSPVAETVVLRHVRTWSEGSGTCGLWPWPPAAPTDLYSSPHRSQDAPMINGSHAILYSHDADATRATLATVLGTRSVDAGGGWLIFALPPAEGLAVHPAEKGRPGRAVSYDRRRRRHRGRTAGRGDRDCQAVSDQGWGLLTAITLPGGIKLGLYQPRHSHRNPAQLSPALPSATSSGEPRARKVGGGNNRQNA
jgi:hypothetical protein